MYIYIYITMHKWKRKGKGLLEHRQPLLGVYAPHHTGVHLWGWKWLKSWNVSAQDLPKFSYEHGLGDMSWNVELRLEKKIEEIPWRSLGDWHLKSSLNRWANELYLPSGWELSRVSSSIFLMKWEVFQAHDRDLVLKNSWLVEDMRYRWHITNSRDSQRSGACRMGREWQDGLDVRQICPKNSWCFPAPFPITFALSGFDCYCMWCDVMLSHICYNVCYSTECPYPMFLIPPVGVWKARPWRQSKLLNSAYHIAG